MSDTDGIEIRIYLRDVENDKTVAYAVPLKEYKEMLLHKVNILEEIMDQLEKRLKYE